MTKPGGSSYTIEYLKEVVRDDIPALPAPMKIMIQRAIEERLTVDPVGFGKPLQYTLKGYRRLRVGDYRVIYRIDMPHQKVLVAAIKNRRDAYDGWWPSA